MEELEARYDTRKSFYGKAIIDIYEDNIVKTEKLYSYGTLVAIYSYDKVKNIRRYDYLGKWSQTTTRHQKEFFKQHGLSDKRIKELFESEVLEINENEY